MNIYIYVFANSYTATDIQGVRRVHSLAYICAPQINIYVHVYEPNNISIVLN